jgi:hypothetical protein
VAVALGSAQFQQSIHKNMKRMTNIAYPAFALLALACFALSPICSGEPVVAQFVINPNMPDDSVELVPEYQEVAGVFAKEKPSERPPGVPLTWVLVSVYQCVDENHSRFLGWTYMDADFVNFLHTVPADGEQL